MRGVHITLRMRLFCEIFRDGKPIEGQQYEVLNEVVVDRGANPYLTKIECYEQGRLITKVSSCCIYALLCISPSIMFSYLLHDVSSLIGCSTCSASVVFAFVIRFNHANDTSKQSTVRLSLLEACHKGRKRTSTVNQGRSVLRSCLC